ncbi:hypothetical protein Pst134EB_006117 [Puccinia striiformis f. sp. tritici]|nr:hypothetical protein Pst134EB_006117 [Puccinia striiformis f. sp. tritici]
MTVTVINARFNRPGTTLGRYSRAILRRYPRVICLKRASPLRRFPPAGSELDSHNFNNNQQSINTAFNMFKFFQTIVAGLLLLHVAMARPAPSDLRGRSVDIIDEDRTKFICVFPQHVTCPHGHGR